MAWLDRQCSLWAIRIYPKVSGFLLADNGLCTSACSHKNEHLLQRTLEEQHPLLKQTDSVQPSYLLQLFHSFKKEVRVFHSDVTAQCGDFCGFCIIVFCCMHLIAVD